MVDFLCQVMSRLVEAARLGMGNDPAEEMHWLKEDATTIIGAGSGTTSSALTFLMYRLASSPTQLEKCASSFNRSIRSIRCPTMKLYSRSLISMPSYKRSSDSTHQSPLACFGSHHLRAYQ